MSAPKIDRALVLHLAKLASLSLTDSEVARFATDLERIVGHVEQLDGLDTRDVPATAHVQIQSMPLRNDDPKPCLSRSAAMAQAPAVDGDGFSVPAFLE